MLRCCLGQVSPRFLLSPLGANLYLPAQFELPCWKDIELSQLPLPFEASQKNTSLAALSHSARAEMGAAMPATSIVEDRKMIFVCMGHDLLLC